MVSSECFAFTTYNSLLLRMGNKKNSSDLPAGRQVNQMSLYINYFLKHGI